MHFIYNYFYSEYLIIEMNYQVIFPIAGKNRYFDGNSSLKHPLQLQEINGKMLIERVLMNYDFIDFDKMHFVINAEDCKSHHLDSIVNILTNNKANIVKINGLTKGSACSCLYTIDNLNMDQPLIIANTDQIFTFNVKDKLYQFSDFEGGTFIFDSLHPRWSYVDLDDSSLVSEASEKNPISRNAIAGFLYFAKASYFVESAFSMIKKDDNCEGEYFISPVLNQMILKGMSIFPLKIENFEYHSFYSPQKLNEYFSLGETST